MAGTYGTFAEGANRETTPPQDHVVDMAYTIDEKKAITSKSITTRTLPQSPAPTSTPITLALALSTYTPLPTGRLPSSHLPTATRIILTRSSMTIHTAFDPAFDFALCEPGVKFTCSGTVARRTTDEEAALLANDGSLTWMEHGSAPHDKFRTPTTVDWLRRHVFWLAVYHLLVLLIWTPTIWLLLFPSSERCSIYKRCSGFERFLDLVAFAWVAALLTSVLTILWKQVLRLGT